MFIQMKHISYYSTVIVYILEIKTFKIIYPY